MIFKLICALYVALLEGHKNSTFSSGFRAVTFARALRDTAGGHKEDYIDDLEVDDEAELVDADTTAELDHFGNDEEEVLCFDDSDCDDADIVERLFVCRENGACGPRGGGDRRLGAACGHDSDCEVGALCVLGRCDTLGVEGTICQSHANCRWF